MSPRQTLFRAMLWALGMSAALGVFAVLTQGGTLVWRIVGTGITTAAACGLMLPTSMLVDRKPTRTAGLLGMSVIILEFVLTLLLIWDLPGVLGLTGWTDSIAQTILFVALGTGTIMLSLRLTAEKMGRIAGPIGIGGTVAWFLVFMIPAWVDWSGQREEDWYLSGMVVAAVGALSMLATAGMGTEPRRHWRVVGVVGALVAGVLWLGDIWVGRGSDPGFVTFVLSLTTSLVVGYANVVILFPLRPGQAWLRTAALLATVATALFIDIIAIDAECHFFRINEDLFIRFASAGGILAGCGSLALCVLARMNRKIDFDTRIGEVTRVTVICPRCQRKQNHDTGDSACATCGLRISIHVEEPRCRQCDYLLIGLTSDRCPECGEPLPTSPHPKGLNRNGVGQC